MEIPESTPIVDYQARARELGLATACVCSWGDECLEFQLKFVEAGDKEYGGDTIYTRIRKEGDDEEGGGSERLEQWRKGIADNLGTDLEDLEEPIKRQRIRVARHHFSRRQISEIHEMPGKSLSTPVKASVLSQYAHFVDQKYSVDKKTKFFHLPNYPHNMVKDEVDALKRQARVQARYAVRQQQQEERERAAFQQQEERERAAFEDLSFEDYTTENRRRDERESEYREAIAEGQERIASLQDELSKQKTKAKSLMDSNRKRRSGSRSSTPVPGEDALIQNPTKLDDSVAEFIRSRFNVFLTELGGLSRATLFCRDWHNKNQTAALTLFGFESYDEMLVYIKDLFPDVDIAQTPTVSFSNDGKISITQKNLSKLEQCIAAKMYMHSIPIRTIVAKIFGLKDTRMGEIIRRWCKRWGKAGEFLSILPMPDWYFEMELPDEFVLRHLGEVAALLDGKDFLLHVKRKDDFMRRIQHSSKVKGAAGRGIAWTTGIGLAFEHTKLFGARVAETKLVQLWGSLGLAEAPLQEWKDWAKREENKDYWRAKLELKTALDDVDYLGHSSAAEQAAEDTTSANTMTNDNDDVSIESGILEVVEVTSPEERELFNQLNDDRDNLDEDVMQNNEQQDEDEELTGDESAPSKYIDATAMFEGDYDTRKTTAAVKATFSSSEDKRRKSIILDSVEDIRGEAKWSVTCSPQSSPLELLYQLEMHERLHQSYESGRLSKTILSYYLKTVRTYRLDLMHWMGSRVVPTDYKPTYAEGEGPPSVALRLAKIPKGKELLGDKGFERTDRFYPHLNHTRTPIVLRTRDVKQYDEAEIVGEGGKKDLCRMRYTSEVSFQRMTRMDGLKDVIPYANIEMLPYMYEWGFAMMNLSRTPQRFPGSKSGVTPAYFDKAKVSKN